MFFNKKDDTVYWIARILEHKFAGEHDNRTLFSEDKVLGIYSDRKDAEADVKGYFDIVAEAREDKLQLPLQLIRYHEDDLLTMWRVENQKSVFWYAQVQPLEVHESTQWCF